MSIPYEHCNGKDQCTGRVVIACSCSSPVALLCESCVMTHLKTPRPHLFLPLDKSIELMVESDSSKTSEQSPNEHLKIKQELDDYILSLQGYKSKILDCKKDILNEVELITTAALQNLDCLLAEACMFLQGLLALGPQSAVDHAVISRYKEYGIKGFMRDYLESFTLIKDNVLSSLSNMIKLDIQTIEPETENSVPHITPPPLNQVPQPCSNLIPSVREIKPSKIASPSSQSIFAVKNGTRKLIRFNVDSSTITTYNLEGRVSNLFNYSSVVQLRSGAVIIAGGYLHGDTMKVDISKEPPKVTKLGDLNFPRGFGKLVEYEDNVYMFGGHTGMGSNKAEMMESGKRSWKIMKDMHEARWDCGVFIQEERIYLVGGRENTSIEYLDTRNLCFYMVENVIVPREGAICAVLNERIYIVGGRDLKIMTREFEEIEHLHHANVELLNCYSDIATLGEFVFFINSITSKVMKFDSSTLALYQDQSF